MEKTMAGPNLSLVGDSKRYLVSENILSATAQCQKEVDSIIKSMLGNVINFEGARKALSKKPTEQSLENNVIDFTANFIKDGIRIFIENNPGTNIITDKIYDEIWSEIYFQVGAIRDIVVRVLHDLKLHDDVDSWDLISEFIEKEYEGFNYKSQIVKYLEKRRDLGKKCNTQLIINSTQRITSLTQETENMIYLIASGLMKEGISLFEKHYPDYCSDNYDHALEGVRDKILSRLKIAYSISSEIRSKYHLEHNNTDDSKFMNDECKGGVKKVAWTLLDKLVTQS